jgi:hypothetical protein
MADLVVSDIAALKIAASIDAMTLLIGKIDLANIAMVSTTFGVAAAKIPGTIPAILAGQAGTQSDILKAISAQTEAIDNLSLAVGKVAASVESITTAAANIQYTMAQQLTTQQLAVSNQVKNNKFQQLTTNAALVRAELPPTEVKPDDMKTAVVNGFQDISLIKAQTIVTSYVSDTITNGTTEGLKIGQAWVAQTAFGKFLTSYTTEAKLSAQIIFADEKTKAKLVLARDQIRTARQTGGSAN